MKPRMSTNSFLRHHQTGFSLLELAVVLMIVGILMSGVLISVSQTTLNARRAAALVQLQQLEEALYGFAESQGRLPCPSSTAPMPGPGYEDISGGGVCNLSHGFVPAATLGIYGQTDSAGLLVDAWGNPLRYSLANAGNLSNPSSPDFSSKSSISNFFTSGSAFNPVTGNMLKICDDPSCLGKVLTNIAPAIIMSMGENWASYTSANETTNAGANMLGGHPVHADTDLIFVAGEYSEEKFDDQLVWLSPYVLFNRMVSAGKLP
jgi:prepilin-type N-terminal cleavage/methylation domain-containing protein